MEYTEPSEDDFKVAATQPCSRFVGISGGIDVDELNGELPDLNLPGTSASTMTASASSSGEKPEVPASPRSFVMEKLKNFSQKMPVKSSKVDREKELRCEVLALKKTKMEKEIQYMDKKMEYLSLMCSNLRDEMVPRILFEPDASCFLTDKQVVPSED